MSDTRSNIDFDVLSDDALAEIAERASWHEDSPAALAAQDELDSRRWEIIEEVEDRLHG